MKIKIENKIYEVKLNGTDNNGQPLIELVKESGKKKLISSNNEVLNGGEIVIAWNDRREFFAIIGELSTISKYLVPEPAFIISGFGKFDNVIKWDGTMEQYLSIKNKYKKNGNK